MQFHESHDASATGDLEGAATPGPEDRRPLGYWLTELDHRLRAAVDAALAEEGVDHREWRALHGIARGGDAPRTPGALRARGWVIDGEDGVPALTDAGRRAHDRLLERVTGVRTRLVDAVGADAFGSTVATLEALARELGWEPGEQAPRSRGPRGGRAHHGRGGPRRGRGDEERGAVGGRAHDRVPPQHAGHHGHGGHHGEGRAPGLRSW
ncbi:hypothetical protein [Agromyces sp. SYSU T00194]|uniref:hypothetical protein n=1 Tax=Agromyces chitinivorans TaxID=3158560 RepID=UPI0033988309